MEIRKYANPTMKRKYELRKSMGLCTKCGGAIEDDREGKLSCRKCQDKNSYYNKERAKLWKSSGYCIHCGAEDLVGATRYCSACWYGSIAAQLCGKWSFGTTIKSLLEEQDYKCAYTGITLTPGLNASVDHKIPKSRGGDNRIENLQWVALRVNIMKRDWTHEEFLKLCHAIAVGTAPDPSIDLTRPNRVYARKT